MSRVKTLQALFKRYRRPGDIVFAWLFFRQIHVNASVILGGLMILAGAMIVIYNNP